MSKSLFLQHLFLSKHFPSWGAFFSSYTNMPQNANHIHWHTQSMCVSVETGSKLSTRLSCRKYYDFYFYFSLLSSLTLIYFYFYSVINPASGADTECIPPDNRRIYHIIYHYCVILLNIPTVPLNFEHTNTRLARWSHARTLLNIDAWKINPLVLLLHKCISHTPGSLLIN